MTSRRSFLTACIATCTFPAIVRASSLMPVSVPKRLPVTDSMKIVTMTGLSIGDIFMINGHQQRFIVTNVNTHGSYDLIPFKTGQTVKFNPFAADLPGNA